MDRYIPGDIYKNIQKLLKYRNIDTNYKFLTIDEFSIEINHYGYILIEGVVAEKKSFVLLFSPESNYALKGPDFKSLFRSKFQKDILETGCDILIISEFPLSNHIKKVIDSFKIDYSKIFIEFYPYDKFIIHIPKHISVPKHEIAPKEEIDDLLTNYYKSKNSFPKMLASDSAAIWIGARPGDVVKISRISDSAGKSIAYRLVI